MTGNDQDTPWKNLTPGNLQLNFHDCSDSATSEISTVKFTALLDLRSLTLRALPNACSVTNSEEQQTEWTAI